jgi:hypothetical protein
MHVDALPFSRRSASIRTVTSDQPTAEEEQAARTWREATQGRDAWLYFRDWLARTEPGGGAGDVPYDQKGLHASHRLFTKPDATHLVLFEKSHVMEVFLEKAYESERTTFEETATASVPFAPTAHDVSLVAAHVQLFGGPIGFVGDLDPHGLHVFGALRSGDLDAPDIAGRRLSIDWLGISDAWLSAGPVTTSSLRGRTIRMGWVEREHWGIIKRCAPGVGDLVGDQCFALLESGLKVEAEAFRDLAPTILRQTLLAPKAR